jgi:hypothetical protein
MIVHKFTTMLKGLQYPASYDKEWCEKLINGDRKVINPILYFVLKDFETHKKNAYIAKYITMIDVPG